LSVLNDVLLGFAAGWQLCTFHSLDITLEG
jgi:hypothetical protein